MDENKISWREFVELYCRRREVENHYRDEKIFLEIERVHSRTPDGIRQELFEIMVMALISRMLMFIADGQKCENEPQFKNLMMTIAFDMAVFVSKDLLRTLEKFEEMLTEIHRVRYYLAKKLRPSQPSVCKRPLNKWACVVQTKGTTSRRHGGTLVYKRLKDIASELIN